MCQSSAKETLDQHLRQAGRPSPQGQFSPAPGTTFSISQSQPNLSHPHSTSPAPFQTRDHRACVILLHSMWMKLSVESILQARTQVSINCFFQRVRILATGPFSQCECYVLGLVSSSGVILNLYHVVPLCAVSDPNPVQHTYSP